MFIIRESTGPKSRDTTNVPAHCDFRYSAGRKANTPGRSAGKCGARIVLGKTEVHTFYDYEL